MIRIVVAESSLRDRDGLVATLRDDCSGSPTCGRCPPGPSVGPSPESCRHAATCTAARPAPPSRHRLDRRPLRRAAPVHLRPPGRQPGSQAAHVRRAPRDPRAPHHRCRGRPDSGVRHCHRRDGRARHGQPQRSWQGHGVDLDRADRRQRSRRPGRARGDGGPRQTRPSEQAPHPRGHAPLPHRRTGPVRARRGRAGDRPLGGHRGVRRGTAARLRCQRRRGRRHRHETTHRSAGA